MTTNEKMNAQIQATKRINEGGSLADELFGGIPNLKRVLGWIEDGTLEFVKRKKKANEN